MKRGILILAIVGLIAAIVALHDGRTLLRAGFPQLAAPLLQDRAAKGYAYLSAGDAATAVVLLKQTTSPEAAYNLGNALALAGKYEEAQKAYKLALIRDPVDRDAIANKALVDAVIATLVEREAAVNDETGISNAGAKIDHKEGRNDTSGEKGETQSSDGDGMVGARKTGSDAAAVGSGKVSRKGDAREDTSDSGEGSNKGSATDTDGKAGKGGSGTDMAESDKVAPHKKVEAAELESQQATLQWLAAIPDDPGHFLKIRIDAERNRRIQAKIAVAPGGMEW